MNADAHRKNSYYGAAQTILFCAFAAAFVFGGETQLFASLAAQYLGIVISVAGLVLMLLAIVSLRNAIQIAPEPRADAQLVTSGFYRWLRHPIYTGIVLVVIGLFLRKPTVAVAIATAVVIAFLLIKARFEETLLLARYSDYADYMTRSWGIVPGSGRRTRRAAPPS